MGAQGPGLRVLDGVFCMAAECVVVLVSTPFAVRNKQNADRINAVGQAESRAIFNTSDFRLRASDVNYIVEPI